MTRINKIVMHGFKSFAKRTEIPLGDKFNVVLGPNGSGKSNVMDAICFVLGKLGSKRLRAEKQANLIYDGGKKGQGAKFARVDIFFDNSDKIFPVTEKEVIITRKVLPTGNSVYRINDKNSSRRGIIDLLSLAKIDPNGYNIILQGDIAKFTEMSADNRRMVIEEIADITLYEEKKHQALLELKKVDSKLNEAKIVLTERKTYLDELRQEYKQALKYKEMTDKIGQNRATYFDLQIKDKQQKLEDLEKRDKKLNNELKTIELKNGVSETEIKDTKKKTDEVNHEIEDKGEKGQLDMHNRIENLRVELSTNQARIETLKEELNKIAQRRDQLNRQYDDLKNRMSNLEKDYVLMQKDEGKYDQEKAQIKDKLQEFKKKHKLHDTTEIEAKVDELDKEAEQISVEMFELREQQQELVREQDKLQIQIDNIDQRIAKMAQVDAQHKSELHTIKKLRVEFKKITLDLNKTINEDSSLAARLASGRQNLLTARESLAKLNERKSSINEKISGNIAIKRVLEMKDPKIHGTVSSLGSVKSQYAMALDVAAGARLTNVVVENVDTAMKCIRTLKENRLGTATFLPLDKLRQFNRNPEVMKLKEANGVHGLALELISYPSKYKKIFAYVFRDTLVVENLEVARRLGVGNVRMVTLEGDLVETSGAMVGGYRRQKGRTLGFQEEEVNKHLSDVETKVKEGTDLVNFLEKKKTENEELVLSMKHQKADFESEIMKLEKSLHLEDEDIDATSSHKKELKLRIGQVGTELAGIIKQISQKTNNLKNVKLSKEKLKQQLSTIKDPKLIAQMSSFEDRLAKIQEELLQLQSNMKNNRLQKQEMFGKEQERVEQVLKQLDKEEQQFSKEIELKGGSSKDLENKLKEMEKKSEEFYSKYKELFKKRNNLADKLRALEVEQARVNEQERQVDLKKNHLSLDRATIKAQLAGLNEEFKPYKNVVLLRNMALQELKREIDKFEAMVNNFGAVNLKALDIFDRVQEEYKSLIQKRDSLVIEREDVEKMMAEIELKKKGLFMKTFEQLNKNFQELFNKLSIKGEAYLRLQNEENPFEAGVEIKVKISGKKFMDLRSLSGGEKAMTALAFIFSIQEYEPASFYIMDEVDAALDKKNTEKLAKLIGVYSKKAQYVVISHNDYMIQNADALFGVSMTEHAVSKVVSIKL